MFAEDMRKTLLTILLALLGCSAMAQDSSYDVFVPIGKYISCGDVESLSAWFAPSLELAVLGEPNDCSKNQAKQILKAFFKTYAPRSFEIGHQAGRENMKYALGDLSASGEHFTVTIFVSCRENSSYQIQQLKIDRMR